MDIERLKTLSEQDRKAVLESEALAVEEGKYQKPLTNDEVLYYKDILAENSINQAVILDEFQQVKDTYKERLKPIKEVISESLEAIKTRSIEKEGRLYKLADFEDQMIHKVDESGNVIHSRKMLPEERQFRIAALNHKTA
jgi:hypothetical protein